MHRVKKGNAIGPPRRYPLRPLHYKKIVHKWLKSLLLLEPLERVSTGLFVLMAVFGFVYSIYWQGSLPEISENAFRQAQRWQKQGKSQKAQLAYARYARLEPRDPMPHVFLALGFARGGCEREAVSSIQKAVQRRYTQVPALVATVRRRLRSASMNPMKDFLCPQRR